MSDTASSYIIHVGITSEVDGEVEAVVSSIEFELEGRGDVTDWDVWYEAASDPAAPQ